MNDTVLHQQNILLQNRERISAEIKKYPNVIHVGVGIKEVSHKLTDILCYRIYVSQKKSTDSLALHERIPASIENFTTDILLYGEIAQALDNGHYRPLKGGIQIKTDLYVDVADRGGGTLGCLAYLNDGSNKIVGLTNQHVVAWNTSDNPGTAKHAIGQPYKHISCCLFTKNIVGKVLKAIKTDRLDCAIIELNNDIIDDIKLKSTINEIHEIGFISGKAIAVANANTTVRKRGAGSGLKNGIITEVAFENNQLLISPVNSGDVFVDFGDSGSILVDDQNRVIGLIWGIKRDRIHNPHQPTVIALPTDLYPPRTHAVATPIDAVETALGIRIPIPPPVVPTITIHADDTKTHVIPSSLTTGQAKKHFVTVKGLGNIILSVTFDNPVDPTHIKWVSDNPDMPVVFPGPSGDNSTATISRDITKGSKAMIGVTVDGYGVGDKVFVWVVWSSPGQNDIKKLDHKITILPTRTNIDQTFKIKYVIQPAEIIHADMDHQDLPDLRKANITPAPNVPATDGAVFAKGNDLSAGALTKWDGSVRLRCRRNPMFFSISGGFNEDLTDYPSVETVGNFDVNASVLDGTPYSNDNLGEFGKIYGDTTIPYTIERVEGHLGSKIDVKIHFQQFARLELSGTWYVISDANSWRMDIKLEKKSESGANTDFDDDGQLLGEDWVANSVLASPDNNDF